MAGQLLTLDDQSALDDGRSSYIIPQGIEMNDMSVLGRDSLGFDPSPKKTDIYALLERESVLEESASKANFLSYNSEVDESRLE